MGKHSHIVTNRNGKRVVLLDPAGKAAKAAAELKCGIHLTNAGKPKANMQTGEVRKLTKSERSYRAGRLDERRDSAKAWCAKNGVQSRAKPRPKRKSSKKSNSFVIWDI